jgi:hypothetical protein
VVPAGKVASSKLLLLASGVLSGDSGYAKIAIITTKLKQIDANKAGLLFLNLCQMRLLFCTDAKVGKKIIARKIEIFLSSKNNEVIQILNL